MKGNMDMTIGEKIRKYRTEKGLYQKDLAKISGLGESAIRNYELGNRTPGPKQLQALADAMEISVYALSDPSLDSELGVMHSLFYLEENFNINVVKENGVVYLAADKSPLYERMLDWFDAFEKYKSGEMTEEEYHKWKSTYPEKVLANK